MRKLIVLGVFVFTIVACNNDNEDEMPNENFTFVYDFETDVDGWSGDFSDYHAGQDERYELAFEYTTLPAPLDESEGSILLTGTNLSDDLFMFGKKKVTGLEAETMYRIAYNVQFASDVPDGTAGIGGSPGESVYVKAGATSIEPLPVENSESYYRMNIDKGNQSQSGNDMVVLGDFSNDTESDTYQLKLVSNTSGLDVESDENGEIWLIVGTDSGFEGTTTIYINSIHVTLDKK